MPLASQGRGRRLAGAIGHIGKRRSCHRLEVRRGIEDQPIVDPRLVLLAPLLDHLPGGLCHARDPSAPEFDAPAAQLRVGADALDDRQVRFLGASERALCLRRVDRIHDDGEPQCELLLGDGAHH
jgi:hypothetical protein